MLEVVLLFIETHARSCVAIYRDKCQKLCYYL